MTQADAVAIALKQLGGYSTLATVSDKALQVPNVQWATKTPYASIRRIVQVDPRFFRVKPGLWALEEMRQSIPFIQAAIKTSSKEGLEFSHSYYQGLLLKLGSLNAMETFVPNQDKNRCFLTQPLKELASLEKIYDFTYPHLVRQASTVDVIWFNQRRMPSSLFEVERSTDIQHSLIKFNELQDFNCNFRVVADSVRRREFDAKICKHTFREIKDRVKFLTFEAVGQMYEKQQELASLSKSW